MLDAIDDWCRFKYTGDHSEDVNFTFDIWTQKNIHTFSYFFLPNPAPRLYKTLFFPFWKKVKNRILQQIQEIEQTFFSPLSNLLSWVQYLESVQLTIVNFTFSHHVENTSMALRYSNSYSLSHNYTSTHIFQHSWRFSSKWVPAPTHAENMKMFYLPNI